MRCEGSGQSIPSWDSPGRRGAEQKGCRPPDTGEEEEAQSSPRRREVAGGKYAEQKCQNPDGKRYYRKLWIQRSVP